jgi:hypothetical protein
MGTCDNRKGWICREIKVRCKEGAESSGTIYKMK